MHGTPRANTQERSVGSQAPEQLKPAVRNMAALQGIALAHTSKIYSAHHDCSAHQVSSPYSEHSTHLMIIIPGPLCAPHEKHTRLLMYSADHGVQPSEPSGDATPNSASAAVGVNSQRASPRSGLIPSSDDMMNQ